MSFEDRPFLILFALTYGLWWVVRRRERTAVGLLLTASLVFYGHNHWGLLPILAAYCVLDWAVALRIERSPRPRLWMILGVTFNLAVLAFYKYTPLVADHARPGGRLRRLGDPVRHLVLRLHRHRLRGGRVPEGPPGRAEPGRGTPCRSRSSRTWSPGRSCGRTSSSTTCGRDGWRRTGRRAGGGRLVARGFFKKMVVADRIGAGDRPVLRPRRRPEHGRGVGPALRLPVRPANLLRLLRLHRHGPRDRPDVRLPLAGELQPALPGDDVSATSGGAGT